MSAAAVPVVKGLNCPNCGGSLSVRAFEHTLTVVCPQCLSVLDAKDPNLQVLQQFEGKQRVTLQIPLGTRGQWQGAVYEVIGFQQRTIRVGGESYSWHEYLLFNPYKGFRYLTVYNGHWNDVRTVRALPESPSFSLRPQALLDGVSYRHFQTADAETTYVLGEFPWQVRRGERVQAMDYVAPPLMLSAEITESEAVWSKSRYVSGEEVWSAFKLQGQPPKPVGVFANQPSTWTDRSKGVWRLWFYFVVAALAVMLFFMVSARSEEVFRQRFTFAPGAGGQQSLVTPTFELKGHTSNVEVSVKTDLSNNWAYFNYALINEETGTAINFGREVSYYSGRDSDGSWTEGNTGDAAFVPSVPPGRYYLLVDPEMAPGATRMDYELRLRRDVARPSFFWFSILFLLIPPVYVTIRRLSFEHQRWQESDYATTSSSSDDGDDD